MPKILTYNTLFYNYSDGTTSYNDQIETVLKVIKQENPDIACLLEMPNIYQEVKSENLFLVEKIEKLKAVFHANGYTYIKCLNNTLSIWILSKYPLIPLLLLGSSTVSGAMNKLILNPYCGPSIQINESSNYIDCLKTTTSSKDDRSIITGVEIDGSVMPLIVVHDKCLFWNNRYSKLRLQLLCAAVQNYGLVVGDFNSNLCNWNTENLSNDKRLDEELFSIADTLRSWELGEIYIPRDKSNNPIPTAQSVKFPFETLYIDGMIAKKEAKITLKLVSLKGNTSDHYPLIAEFFDDICLPSVKGSRASCMKWFLNQGSLAKTYDKRIEIPNNCTQSLVPMIIESSNDSNGYRETTSPNQRVNNFSSGRGEPLPISKSLPIPYNDDTKDSSYIDNDELVKAAEYLKNNLNGAKICHTALKGSKERNTYTNSYGPSCHFNCKLMHEKAIENHPILMALINRDNTYNSGSNWRTVCAYKACNGYHSSKAY